MNQPAKSKKGREQILSGVPHQRILRYTPERGNELNHQPPRRFRAFEM
jgi:hypothetical protein